MAACGVGCVEGVDDRPNGLVEIEVVGLGRGGSLSGVVGLGEVVVFA